MKKTFIYIAILLSLTVAGATYAATKIVNKPVNTITLPAGTSFYITSTELQSYGLQVIKFVDGKNTCYVTQRGAAIDCNFGI